MFTGFPKVVECRTLARGEHSFNYLGPQSIPDEVTTTSRFVTDTTDRTARVSLASLRKDVKDGELFFVLSDGGAWTVEYAPHSWKSYSAANEERWLRTAAAGSRRSRRNTTRAIFST